MQQVRAFLADRRAAHGLKRVSRIGVEDSSQLRRQVGQKRASAMVDSRAGLGPMGGGHRRAAIAVLAAYGLELESAGTMIMQRFPQAAGMWGRSRDRQGDGSEGAHEKQNKQQSGGQTAHGW